MYTDIDSYISKILKLMDNNYRYPKIILKKHDHNIMIQ